MRGCHCNFSPLACHALFGFPHCFYSQRLDEALRERDASLDFVSEQAARIEHFQMRAESADRAAEALHQRVRDVEAEAAVSALDGDSYVLCSLCV